MAVAKKYNPVTQQWEPIIVGASGANGLDGAQGPTGPQGPAGADGPAGPAGPAGADGLSPTVSSSLPTGGNDGDVWFVF
jgi:hypothetical protein